MKQVLFTLLLLFGGISMMHAQRVVSGKITDSAGEALIGANVAVVGAEGVGTITDIDGMFSLKVPADASTLKVSYTGYESQEISIVGLNTVDVTLAEGKLLDEVVVTALGIKRNSREVPYANQTVKAEDLLALPSKNTLEALRGKTAGVKISTGSGSVGASSRIVLRGESSLTGNNNALIVVDGIPIDNSANGSNNPSAQSGYADYGNRFNDINPEDIESVTVLKGAAATSVYGSRAASGVILVTTKKGGGDKVNFKVGLNSSYSVEKAYLLLQRQDQFGQGYDNNSFDSGENWSWGPAFDGVVRPWTSPVTDENGNVTFLSRPYSAVPNQIQNFFRLGNTLTNSVYMSGSKDNFTYYMSYGNTNQNGILDNTSYKRNTLNLKASSKLSSRLSADFGVNFARSNVNTAQEGYRPFDGQNAYANAIQAPVNIPYNELRDYNSVYHSFQGYYGSYSTNPYFILNEYKNEGKFDNLLANIGLKFDVAKNFFLTGRVGLNTVSGQTEAYVPVYEYPEHIVWVDNLQTTTRGNRQVSSGEYNKQFIRDINTDFTVLGNYMHDFSDDLKFTVSAGYNFFDRRNTSLTGESVGGLVIPGWYNFANSNQGAKTSENINKYRIYGILGNAQFAYKNMLFLDYSARNDYSSTLPEQSNSFFYQALGASFILSKFLDYEDNDILNFTKLRASYGTTGKDAALYLLSSTFQGSPTIQSLGNNHDIFFPINGVPGFTLDNTIGNPDLKPELTKTFDVGVDLGFFDNRMNLEYTYYSSNHTDQIVIVSLPASSGFGFYPANIGKMTNKGHELVLRTIPVLTSKFKWNVDATWSKNVNKVINISDTQDELVVGGPFTNGSISVVAAKNLPYGTFKSTVPVMHDGKMVVDGNGFPVLTDEEQYLGSYQPDFLASLSSGLSYQNFRISGLLDIRKGGKFLSITKNQTEFNGTALTTLQGNREPFVIPNSVVQLEDGSYVANETAVTAQELYAVSDVLFGGNSLLIDASYVKLRELTLGYSFPKKSLSKTPFSTLNLDVYATNLKFWLPAENTYADPEINGPSLTGNATGIETTQTPPSRSYGIKLGIVF
ncbi:MAG: SusC/RagA family TonB-linked outer membrane protein [Lewinellaceae bacterium]|nr:SusC/RagA family TonB-linked outer membrane protein [Lewinellaceae bacterium]